MLGEVSNDSEGQASVMVERVYSKPIDMCELGRDPVWKLTIAQKQKALAERLHGRCLFLETCPICGAAQLSLFVKIYGYPYQECQGCGHIFCQTPPSPAAVRALYSEDCPDGKSVQADVYTKLDTFSKRMERIALPKAEFISRRAINKGGLWIDLGAGAGDLVLAATRLGWKAIGLESDPEEVAFGTSMGACLEKVFLTEDNIASHIAGADVVTMLNVLEHVPNPVSLLRSIQGELGPEAILAFEVPRHPSLSSLASLAFPDYANRHIYSPDHIHIFTENSLGKALCAAGLKLNTIWNFGQDVYEVIMDMSLQSGIQESPLIKDLLAAVPKAQEAVDQCGMSDTMLVISSRENSKAARTCG